MMVVRATCDMDAGTELVWWYNSPTDSIVADNKRRLDQWGFKCDCNICQDDRDTSAAMLAERKRLLKQLKQTFDTPGSAKANKAGRLLESMEKTYSKPANEVPRLQFWDPCFAVAQIYVEQNRPEKSLEWIGKTLESIGFIFTGLDSSSTVFSIVKWGVIVDILIVIFMQARNSFLNVGQLGKASRAEEYARVAYKVVVGEDDTFKDSYP
jgi:hypothetical protein